MTRVYCLIIFLLSFYAGCQTTIPLEPCPNSPNCVQTNGEKVRKNMSVLPFNGDLEATRAKVKALVLDFEGTKLTEEKPNYLHFEFRTSIGNFIDDVEFYLDESTQSIHFRSASRKGYGDFGANKRRMRRISKKWKTVT